MQSFSLDYVLLYLRLAIEEWYIEGWIEGCLQRSGEDNPDEEQIFRTPWEDETQREVAVESLKADCVVRRGRPPGL